MGYNKLIGGGIVFPLRVSNGSIEVTTTEDLIKSSIMIILHWPIGTRSFFGIFGSYITRLLEKQNTQTINKIIDTYIIDPLMRWEKRIDNITATVVPTEDESKIFVQIGFRIIETQQETSFIVPFIKYIVY